MRNNQRHQLHLLRTLHILSLIQAHERAISLDYIRDSLRPHCQECCDRTLRRDLEHLMRLHLIEPVDGPTARTTRWRKTPKPGTIKLNCKPRNITTEDIRKHGLTGIAEQMFDGNEDLINKVCSRMFDAAERMLKRSLKYDDGWAEAQEQLSLDQQLAIWDQATAQLN